MLPCREILAARHDDHIAPSLVETGVAAFLDHGVLRFPERIGVGKIPVLAEPVGANRKPARLDTEHRMIDLERRTAASTFFTLDTFRTVSVKTTSIALGKRV